MLIQKNTARKVRGFTLTEAAIVLGIVGLILGAIWSAAGAVFRNQRVGQTSQQLIQIVQAIRSMNASTPVLPTNLVIKDLISAGAFPKDMVDSGGNNAINLWGGKLAFDSSGTCGATGTAGNCFRLTFPNIPPEACIDLLSRNAGPGHDSGLYSASGNGTEVTNSDTGVVATVTSAAAACGNANTPVNVIFTFMLKG